MLSNTVKHFKPENIPQVTALWRTAFGDHGLTEESLNGHTFANSLFDPAGTWVALAGETVVGFGLATVMAIPEIGPDELPGCIPVIMVHPDYRKRGIGGTLIKKAEDYLKSKGKTKVRPGYPTYLRGTILSFIGVNTKWKEAFWFFRHYGYHVADILDSAQVDLTRFQVPKVVLDAETAAINKGIHLHVLTMDREEDFLCFLKQNFDDWYREFARRFALHSIIHENVIILTDQENIIGFTGPFDVHSSGEAALGSGIGVNSVYRGMGLGHVILFRTLERIRDQGGRTCNIFGPGPKRFYEQAGFVLGDLWIFMEKVF